MNVYTHDDERAYHKSGKNKNVKRSALVGCQVFKNDVFCVYVAECKLICTHTIKRIKSSRIIVNVNMVRAKVYTAYKCVSEFFFAWFERLLTFL